MPVECAQYRPLGPFCRDDCRRVLIEVDVVSQIDQAKYMTRSVSAWTFTARIMSSKLRPPLDPE